MNLRASDPDAPLWQLLAGGRGHGKNLAQAEAIRQMAMFGDVRIIDGAVVIDRRLNEPTGLMRYLMMGAVAGEFRIPDLSVVYEITRKAMLLFIRQEIPEIKSVRWINTPESSAGAQKPFV